MPTFHSISEDTFGDLPCETLFLISGKVGKT